MSESYARWRVWPAAAAFTACLVATGEPAPAGDGSGTDNPYLLRGTYSLGCEDGGLCTPSESVPSSSGAMPIAAPATTRPGNCETLRAAGIVSAECAAVLVGPAPRNPAAPAPVPQAQSKSAPAPVAARRQARPEPVAEPPVESLLEAPPAAVSTAMPPADAAPVATGAIGGVPSGWDDAVTGDWSLALRGTSTWDGLGQSYAVSVGPQGQLTFHRARGEMRLVAGLGLAYSPGGAVRIDSGNGALEIDHALARDLMLRTAFSLSAARETTNALTSPAGQEQGPLSVLGKADAALDMRAGRTGVLIGATMSRQFVGDTTLAGGATSANIDRNWSGFGLRARTSYALTPILTAFVEASADRAVFDAVNIGLGAAADNWGLRGVAGVDGRWSSGLTASLYGGYGLTVYDSALVASGGGYVIGGSLSYPVMRGGEIGASLETGMSPTGSVAGATTKIAYAGTLNGRYMVNDWLTLRGALGGSWSIFPGATYSEAGASAGLGIDWALGPHAAVNADYTFGLNWTPTGDDQSHTVSVGMTFSR